MIDNLPFDLKLEFMKYCDMKTFTNLYMTNKEFHGIMKSFINIDDLSFRKQIPKNIKTKMEPPKAPNSGRFNTTFSLETFLILSS